MGILEQWASIKNGSFKSNLNQYCADEWKKLAAENRAKLLVASMKVEGIEACLRAENAMTTEKAIGIGCFNEDMLKIAQRSLDSITGGWLCGDSRIGKSTFFKCKIYEYAEDHQKKRGYLDEDLCKMFRWEMLWTEYLKRFQDNKDEKPTNIQAGIESMKRCKILVIDEMPSSPTDAAQRLLFEILEKRCHDPYKDGTDKMTFFTSNYDIKNMRLNNLGLEGRIRQVTKGRVMRSFAPVIPTSTNGVFFGA